MKLNIKEKISSLGSIFSSILSFLGSYQICHNVCLVIIAILGLLGITIVGMPLLFLTKVAVPFWILAITLFIITLILYSMKKCISKTILLINLGVIIAGTPSQFAQNYQPLLWVLGGSFILLGMLSYIKNKKEMRKWRKILAQMIET